MKHRPLLFAPASATGLCSYPYRCSILGKGKKKKKSLSYKIFQNQNWKDEKHPSTLTLNVITELKRWDTVACLVGWLPRNTWTRSGFSRKGWGRDWDRNQIAWRGLEGKREIGKNRSESHDVLKMDVIGWWKGQTTCRGIALYSL